MLLLSRCGGFTSELVLQFYVVRTLFKKHFSEHFEGTFLNWGCRNDVTATIHFIVSPPYSLSLSGSTPLTSRGSDGSQP